MVSGFFTSAVKILYKRPCFLYNRKNRASVMEQWRKTHKESTVNVEISYEIVFSEILHLESRRVITK